MICWIVNFLTNCSWLLIFSWLSLIFALRKSAFFVFSLIRLISGGSFARLDCSKSLELTGCLLIMQSGVSAYQQWGLGAIYVRGSFYLRVSDFLTYCSWLLILQSAFFTRSLIIVPLAGLSPVALPRSRPLAETRKLPNEHSRGLT